jgi:hypothetical protein
MSKNTEDISKLQKSPVEVHYMERVNLLIDLKNTEVNK